VRDADAEAKWRNAAFTTGRHHGMTRAALDPSKWYLAAPYEGGPLVTFETREQLEGAIRELNIDISIARAFCPGLFPDEET
jgi:hypothetical protein